MVEFLNSSGLSLCQPSSPWQGRLTASADAEVVGCRANVAIQRGFQALTPESKWWTLQHLPRSTLNSPTIPLSAVTSAVRAMLDHPTAAHSGVELMRARSRPVCAGRRAYSVKLPMPLSVSMVADANGAWHVFEGHARTRRCGGLCQEDAENDPAGWPLSIATKRYGAGFSSRHLRQVIHVDNDVTWLVGH